MQGSFKTGSPVLVTNISKLLLKINNFIIVLLQRPTSTTQRIFSAEAYNASKEKQLGEVQSTHERYYLVYRITS